ncbi:MAG TPA: hypothetical protein VEZ14_04220 [Dehalococcoidia bacterium]|nr:hypothetical protein [Dehalococcoidia bacterium]
MTGRLVSAAVLVAVLTASGAARAPGTAATAAAARRSLSIGTCASLDIASGLGWDSATAWISNGMPQIASDWYGSLFTGNDNAFFASSSAAFRFPGVGLTASDSVLRATLTLDQGSIAYSTGGVWTMRLVGDSADGSNFSGLTRAAFLARFDASPAVSWQVADISATRPAQSPDIAALVNARLQDPAWQAGDAIVVGVLNDMTFGRAETGIVKSAHSAVLHIEWTDGAGTLPPCTDDADGDGYTGVQELLLGKDPSVYCAIMRADVTGDGAVAIDDLAKVAAYFGRPVPPAPPRYDQNADNVLTIADLGRQAAVFGQRVTACP